MPQRANPIRRILATLIDFVIFYTAAWLISLLIEPALRARIQTEWRADYLLNIIMLSLLLLYSSLEMIVAATPGKILLKLRIVRVDGAQASTSMLVLRWLTKQLPYILGVFELLMVNQVLGLMASFMNTILWIGCLRMLDEDRRSWLDEWAHTAVIRKTKSI